MTYAPVHSLQSEVNYLNWLLGEGNVSYGRMEAIEDDIEKAWTMRRPELTPAEVADEIETVWLDLKRGNPGWDGPNDHLDYVDINEWRYEYELYCNDTFGLPLWVEFGPISTPDLDLETPAWIKRLQDEDDAEFIRSERRYVRDTSPRIRRRERNVRLRGTGSSEEACYRRHDRRLQRYAARTEIAAQLAD